MAAEAVTLVASAARTADGTQDLPSASNVGAAVFFLDVSAAATDAGDTLNVRVQHSLDDGTTWDDFVSFTQVLGNGGAKKFIASWTESTTTPESEVRVPADGTLAAGGVLQGPVGEKWRAKWAIVDAGTDNASFTFALTARLLARR